MIQQEENSIINDKHLSELQSFFSRVQLPIGPFDLDKCTRINDISLFISSHIGIVRFQIRNQRYKPYLERLLLFKNRIIN